MRLLKYLLKFLTFGYYGGTPAKEPVDTTLFPPTSRLQIGEILPNPLKLRKGQSAYYFSGNGVMYKDDEMDQVVVPSWVVFKCAAFKPENARSKFRTWAENNLPGGDPSKMPRSKRGFFTLLLLMTSMSVFAQDPGGSIMGGWDSDESIVSSDSSSIVSLRTYPPVLCFNYHEPVSVEGFRTCIVRGHVEAPGMQLAMEYDSLPYIEDTDSISYMVYPGTTRIDRGCLRCGVIVTEVITDLRRPIWVRREQGDKR